jgi:hypothetical protein
MEISKFKENKKMTTKTKVAHGIGRFAYWSNI